MYRRSNPQSLRVSLQHTPVGEAVHVRIFYKTSQRLQVQSPGLTTIPKTLHQRPDFRTRNPNTEYRIPNTETQTPNPEHQITNPNPKTPNRNSQSTMLTPGVREREAD